MLLVFIHGPAASGKLTVAEALRDQTGLRLFHNHLVVDTLLAVFPFGSPSFVRLREELWLAVIAEAITQNVSLIFTFNPEATVSPTFPARVADQVRNAGGRFLSVKFVCDEVELDRRVSDASRSRFKKLTSVDTYRALRQASAFAYPAIPSDLEMDTGKVSPDEAARAIAQVLDARGPD